MKILFTLGLLLILLLFGCDQGSDITYPDIVSNSIEILPDIPPEIEVIPWPYPPGADSIFIPINLPESVIPNLKKSKFINGKKGGKIEIYFEHSDTLNNTFTFYAKLDVPKQAFEGIKEITMVVDNKIGTVSFSPPMVFNKPVKYSVRYSGIDLSGIDPNTVDFVFQNYDGSTEQINYYKLNANIDIGELDLQNAELPHFSRYGWIR